MLIADASTSTAHTNAEGVRWEWLLRGGNSWIRSSRPNLCYPILLSRDGTQIVRAGAPLEGPENDRPMVIDGCPVAWPLRRDGRLGIWRVDSTRFNWLAANGYAYVSDADRTRGTWTLKYLMSGVVDAIERDDIEVVGRDEQTGRAMLQAKPKDQMKVAKTVWFRGRHIAGGSGGTMLLTSLLGGETGFSYPKSVYAVADALRIAVGGNAQATVLDFFAGSGTTTHAVSLLNREDGGRRTSISITNNEVSLDESSQLLGAGHTPGTEAWEQRGIYSAVTRPRVTAAVTGRARSGDAAVGNYLSGEAYADGLEENVEFLELEYLDHDAVARGQAFTAIAPLLWMKAGALGARIDVDDGSWAIPADAVYGVLFNARSWGPFVDAVRDRPDLRHAFVVTDSLAVFQQVTSELPPELPTTMLYEDYLSNFEINTGDPR